MADQIKTENNDHFCERLEETGGINTTTQEIMEAIEAFEEIMNICITIANIKLEDLQEFYNIEIYHIGAMTVNDVKDIYEETVTRYRNLHIQYKNSKTKRNWYQNQLRIFVWILFYYSEAKQLPIEKFNNQQWQLIAKAFVGKTVDDVRFEWLLLTKSTSASAHWTVQQDSILEKLMNQPQYHNKWIDIAKIIYQKSGSSHFRKPKQCRQRWKNYLNPTIEKGQWSIDQDKKLFQLVVKFGKKWSTISKTLFTRTQHAVKNRYKSLLKKFKKDHSIRQKPKSAKGLHTKQLQYISQIINNLKQKCAFFGQQDNQYQIKQRNIPSKLETSQKNQQQSSKDQQKQQKQESALDRFYPISPGSAWKYCDRNYPAVLTIIQSPRILTPKILSPSGFRFPVAMWQQDTAKLFYS